jgi:hypothetical protein
MKSSCESPLASSATVLAHASRRVPIEDIAPLRKNPAANHKFPLSLLKNADEQTVVVIAALMEAVDRLGQPLEAYRDWAALAAPRFIGRDCIGQAIPEYTREGPWSVSPHIIPHRSLHSTSGTITLALGSGGPNHGVGGGPDGETEGLLTAFAMLHERPIPGVWLALSRVTPLQRCDLALGRPMDGCFVEATVLALTRQGPGLPLTLEFDEVAPRLDLDQLQRVLQTGGTVKLGRLGQPLAA